MSSEVGQLGHFFCWIFSPQDGETDLQAAFRAASELRNAGLKHFGDGSRFCGSTGSSGNLINKNGAKCWDEDQILRAADMLDFGEQLFW